MAVRGLREQWGPVCCHLAASADYFKTKPFGAIASLGNLAEHSSRFIAPCPHKTLHGSSLASLNKSNHWRSLLEFHKWGICH